MGPRQTAGHVACQGRHLSQLLTMGFESESRSRSMSRKPWSSTSWALMSCSLATDTAAVLRTYGSSSLRHLRSGSHRYSVILSTRIHPMVRTASARISGLLSSQSCRYIIHRVTALLAVSAPCNPGFTDLALLNLRTPNLGNVSSAAPTGTIYRL